VRIDALLKTTLIDFPGKVSAAVFTQGCNFRCPYCHNPDLVPGRGERLDVSQVLTQLEQRRHLLEGVVVTGGEPTLQGGLAEFCASLKAMGYAVKLDTNGSRPDALQHLLRSGLVDYVAMDLKAQPTRYPPELAPEGTGSAVADSMAHLKGSGIPHEYRIPCVAPFISDAAFREIIDAVGDEAPVFLQAVRLDRVLTPDFFPGMGHAMSGNEMDRLRRMATAAGVNCLVR
jgi:pyruvate formate lyase activating enzyme